jgi:hypothetical protein
MLKGIYRKVLDVDSARPARLDERYASIVLNGVGLVIADRRDRILQPASALHAERLLEALWGDPRKAVERMVIAEQMASEALGEGVWRWHMPPSDYHVCPCCGE